MTTLYRLAYYSRNRLEGSPEAVTASIQAILAASRRNNPRVDVTGALMFNRGCFAQVLEGPRDGVGRTFERVQQDERHGDVSLLAFTPVEARAFDGWSMAYVGESQTDAEIYGSIAAESGFDPSRMTSDTLFETLQRLAVAEEAAA